MEKNSEDEEGQLEEQIERLQEKVESAQSEQKNLFLVIFQVGWVRVCWGASARHCSWVAVVSFSVSSCC